MKGTIRFGSVYQDVDIAFRAVSLVADVKAEAGKSKNPTVRDIRIKAEKTALNDFGKRMLPDKRINGINATPLVRTD
ncbi:MAG: hypothetical protein ABI481_04905 [Pyrinomonadaceae bacterium]